jgi:hypothetical protein
MDSSGCGPPDTVEPMREALYIAPDVAAVRRTLAPLIDRPDWHATPIERQLEEQADALLATHALGDLGFRPVLSSWHPEHAGASAARLLSATSWASPWPSNGATRRTSRVSVSTGRRSPCARAVRGGRAPGS